MIPRVIWANEAGLIWQLYSPHTHTQACTSRLLGGKHLNFFHPDSTGASNKLNSSLSAALHPSRAGLKLFGSDLEEDNADLLHNARDPDSSSDLDLDDLWPFLQQKYFNAIIYTDRPGWNANFTGSSWEHSRNLNSKMEVGWRAQAAIWCLSLEVWG